MTIHVELDAETEARIGAAAEALAITPDPYATAFIEECLKLSEAGVENPGIEADRLVHKRFSKR